MPARKKKLEKATLGMGCFWCTEAVFQRVKGVKSVVSGYSGGTKKNPTYEQVCSGTTGHAEALQIIFDPKEVSYERLLEIFWETHDPTQLDGQGWDVGTQYRSVIFYHDGKQRRAAEKSLKEVQKQFSSQIVTQIEQLKNFYEAEHYNQNYYNDHRNAPYCMLVIRPKLKKLEKITA